MTDLEELKDFVKNVQPPSLEWQVYNIALDHGKSLDLNAAYYAELDFDHFIHHPEPPYTQVAALISMHLLEAATSMYPYIRTWAKLLQGTKA